MNTVAAWFLYAMVVANLLGLAGVAFESALRGAGKAGRWSWVLSLGASVLLPVLAYLGLGVRSMPSVPASVLIPIAPIAMPTVETLAGGTHGSNLSQILVGAWLSGTAVMVLFTVLSWLSIRRERRTWRRRFIDGVEVMVTADRGPAVYGLRRAEILLPEWSLKLEARFRRLMLLHEFEHARAGDTRLMVFGLAVVGLAPWNLPLWWQFRRLREAIELDCDARVLRRAPDARRYGALLLEVGWRRSAPMLGVALAEPASFLERRIRMITSRPRRASLHRIASLTGLAAALAAVAICTRDPLAAVDSIPLLEVPTPVSTSAMTGPAIREQTVSPQVLNSDEADLASVTPHPDAGERPETDPSGDDAGSAGTPPAAAAPVGTGSAARPNAPGDMFGRQIERLSAQVRMSMPPDRGQPAGGRTDRAPVEPPSLESRVPVPQLAHDNIVSLPPRRETQAAGPTWTSFTQPPRIRNPDDVARALEQHYPVLLRTSGVGGTVKVWFHIDADGRVLETVVGETSGFTGLDAAGLRVAREMEFDPALNGRDRIAVWVSLPIKFSTR